MSQTFRIAVARSFGAPEVIEIEKHPLTELPSGVVRVAVRAAGQNPVDARRRAGTFGGRPPKVFGTEFSGVVYQSNDPRWNAGDEVVGWGASGAVADLVVTDGAKLAAKPEGMDWLVAGGLSGAGYTALTALDAMKFPEGALILVHGAAGGVGSALVQLAVARGYRVIGTAGTANQDYLRELGALPVVYGPGLIDRVAQASDGKSLDGSIDLAGSIEAGDLAQQIRQSGGQAITLVPETWQSHGLPLVSVKHDPSYFGEMAKAYQAGTFRLEVNPLPFTEIVQAHKNMDAKHSRGKLVLDLADNPYLAA